MDVIAHDPDCDCCHGEGFVDHGPSVSMCRCHDVMAAEAELVTVRQQLRGAVVLDDAAVGRATTALLEDSGLPPYGNYRATIERRVRLAFAAAGGQ